MIPQNKKIGKFSKTSTCYPPVQNISKEYSHS
jgi:hypothetical protein